MYTEREIQVTVSIPSYVVILEEEFQRRIVADPSYSLRSFAKFLQINPGTLSLILNRKRPLSLKMANLILPRLNLNPEEEKNFLRSVFSTQKSRPLKRKSKSLQEFVENQNTPPQDRTFVSNEMFEVISSWLHQGILELMHSEDYLSDTLWMAEQFGVHREDIQKALDRLVAVGLVKIVAGRYERTKLNICTKDWKKTSDALKEGQRQLREKAIESLLQDELRTRSMTSLTMCMDPDLLPEVKKMISQFQKNLFEFVEGHGRKKVYTLEMSLFPLQKTKKKDIMSFDHTFGESQS